MKCFAALKLLVWGKIFRRKRKGETIQLLVRYKVQDRDGKETFNSGWRKSNCFVLQFLQLVYCIFGAKSDVTVKDTGGTNRTVLRAGDNRINVMRVDGPASNDDYGIVAGTGTNAEDNRDYQLQTQIAHGPGAGQLMHGEQTFTAPTIVLGNVDYYLERAFTNASGGLITVEEVGVYGKSRDTTESERYFCLLRDLTGGIAVASGRIFTVEYCWRTTV